MQHSTNTRVGQPASFSFSRVATLGNKTPVSTSTRGTATVGNAKNPIPIHPRHKVPPVVLPRLRPKR